MKPLPNEERNRQIILLHDVCGLSLRVIAMYFQLSHEGVRRVVRRDSRIRRAIEQRDRFLAFLVSIGKPLPPDAILFDCQPPCDCCG